MISSCDGSLWSTCKLGWVNWARRSGAGRQGWGKALGMESKTWIVLPLHLDLLSLLVCYFGDGCKPSLGASTRLHNCDCKSTVLPWEQGGLHQPWKLSPSLVGFVQLEGAYRKAQVEADLPEDDSIFKWEVASVYRTSAFLRKEGPKQTVWSWWTSW